MAKKPVKSETASIYVGKTVPEGGKAAWRYVHCSGYDWVCLKCGARHRHSPSQEARIADAPKSCRRCAESEFEQRFHYFENIVCDCPPGPHELVLVTNAFEIGGGGGRGSGKTEDGFPLSVRGNPGRVRKAREEGKAPDPVDVSYINSPRYRFLVLRKNAKDLKDFWHKAKRFYSHFGASFNDSDMVMSFPCGAEGVADHLANEDAYQKYQGQEFQFIWVEELGQIPSEKLYIQSVYGSCRSSFPEIIEKIYTTFNPGGPGAAWVNKRFREIGPPGTVYDDGNRTRVFFHSTVFDNPFFLRGNAGYVKSLMSIPDETLRRQWLLGDFDALEGQFFAEFRDKRHPNEPAAALHVVPAASVQLLPYWRRWMAMDWGFSHNAAVVWNCYAADQRIYTYRELSESGVGSHEWGVRIAQASVGDLNGLADHHLTLYLSPDAFAKRDDVNTPAEQIAAGIADVLGPGSAFIVDFTDDERTLPADKAWESLLRRERMQKYKTSITIRPAQNARIAGWGYMRDLLRWWPMLQDAASSVIDPGIAQQLLQTQGVLAYAEYQRKIEAMRNEVLPKWRILDSCPKAIRAMLALQYKEGTEDVEDSGAPEIDMGDALRYAVAAFKDTRQNAKPAQYQVQDALSMLPENISAHSRAQVAQAALARANKQNHPFVGLIAPRSVGRHKRSVSLVN